MKNLIKESTVRVNTTIGLYWRIPEWICCLRGRTRSPICNSSFSWSLLQKLYWNRRPCLKLVSFLWEMSAVWEGMRHHRWLCPYSWDNSSILFWTKSNRKWAVRRWVLMKRPNWSWMSVKFLKSCGTIPTATVLLLLLLPVTVSNSER